jgi:plasmid stability protein
MAVTITLTDDLAARLRSRADAQRLSLEAFALDVLGRAAAGEPQPGWDAKNQRRLELIDKQFTTGLAAEEQRELQHLQDLTDRRLEGFDSRRLEHLARLEEAARQAVGPSAG